MSNEISTALFQVCVVGRWSLQETALQAYSALSVHAFDTFTLLAQRGRADTIQYHISFALNRLCCFLFVFSARTLRAFCLHPPYRCSTAALRSRHTTQKSGMVRFVPFIAASVTLGVTAGSNVPSSNGELTFSSIPQARSIGSCTPDERIYIATASPRVSATIYLQRTPGNIGDIFVSVYYMMIQW